MEYIEVINWGDTQHYTDRNAPWLKLQDGILDDYRYSMLPDSQKLLLISIYLLANKTNNKIPNDERWIKSKAMLHGRIELGPLVASEFIRIKQNGTPDTVGVLAKRKACASNLNKVKKEYGEFCNVLLTEEEYGKLSQQFGKTALNEKINNLSQYIASKGRHYRSHYATILMWNRKHSITTDDPKLFDHRVICKACKEPKSPLIGGLCNECRESQE